MSLTIAQRLEAWRAAARRWDADPVQDPAGDAGQEVVRTWLAYQEATLQAGRHEFLLVADDSHRYVAASSGVSAVLGYSVDELIRLTIDDLAPPHLAEAIPAQWARFLDDGSQEGEFVLRAADGSLVPVTFHARTNHPIPGIHVSRLRPVPMDGRSEDSRPSEMVSRLA